jgi:hypothetical protein
MPRQLNVRSILLEKTTFEVSFIESRSGRGIDIRGPDHEVTFLLEVK